MSTIGVPCSDRVLPITFFQGLPQGIPFYLWLERSFDIVNDNISFVYNMKLHSIPTIFLLVPVCFHYTMVGTCCDIHTQYNDTCITHLERKVPAQLQHISVGYKGVYCHYH